MSRALWVDKVLDELEACELELDKPIFVCPSCQGVSNNATCMDEGCQADALLRTILGEEPR